MTSYGVSLDVTLDQPLDDDQLDHVAVSWAYLADLALAGQTRSPDSPRLVLDGLLTLGEDVVPSRLATLATKALRDVLAGLDRRVVAWHAIEVLDETRIRDRARPVLPPLVDADQLATLCGVTRSRVYQWASERPAGFPAPVVPGYWLAAEAQYWAVVRPTKPGPRPAAAPIAAAATG